MLHNQTIKNNRAIKSNIKTNHHQRNQKTKQKTYPKSQQRTKSKRMKSQRQADSLKRVSKSIRQKNLTLVMAKTQRSAHLIAIVVFD